MHWCKKWGVWLMSSRSCCRVILQCIQGYTKTAGSRDSTLSQVDVNTSSGRPDRSSVPQARKRPIRNSEQERWSVNDSSDSLPAFVAALANFSFCRDAQFSLSYPCNIHMRHGPMVAVLYHGDQTCFDCKRMDLLLRHVSANIRSSSLL